MAELVFVDGSRVKVDYNKAAEIYQFLVGNEDLDPKDPKFTEKEAFLLKVKRVKFDDRKDGKSERPWEDPRKLK